MGQFARINSPGWGSREGLSTSSWFSVGDCRNISGSGTIISNLILSSVFRCVCSIRDGADVCGFNLLDAFPTAVFGFSQWGGKSGFYELDVSFSSLLSGGGVPSPSFSLPGAVEEAISEDGCC